MLFRSDDNSLLHLKIEPKETFNWDETALASSMVPEDSSLNNSFELQGNPDAHLFDPNDQFASFIQIDMPLQPCFSEPLFSFDSDFDINNASATPDQSGWYEGEGQNFVQASNTTNSMMETQALEPCTTKLCSWERKDANTFTSLLLHD